jgi:hypothetical protein
MRVLLLLIIFCANLLKGQTGNAFPVIHGISLDNKSITVPPKNGKYTVVAIAFHKQAEDQLKKWLNPLYDTFIKKDGEGQSFDVADIYDINFVFVPLISGFKKIAEDFKKGTDKQFWPYILDAEKTDIQELQNNLKVEDAKIPYFYVLDEKGKIIDVQKGIFTEAKLDKLEESIK